MASGKTTVGKRLAEKLGLRFTDTDEFIENRYRKTIAKIFEEHKESGFRNIERCILKEVSGFKNVVISTGGGLPCFFDNMEVMNAAGLTVYLKVSAEELTTRLFSAIRRRPLVENKSLQEMKDYVESSLQQRKPFYEKAAIVSDCETLFKGENFERTIEEIIKQLP